MSRKGIILAGGSGTRLHPLTLVTSKQLLPVYDKPMIYYPLSMLVMAGINEILIITTPEEQTAFQRLLGDGSDWGLKLSFATQQRPEGIAQAFLIAEEFLARGSAALILGDNIFHGVGLGTALKRMTRDLDGGLIFGYPVADPTAYGVVEFDATGRAVSIEEKPARPRSRYAVPGLYFYDADVVKIAASLKPSARGELEITAVNEEYLRQNRLRVNVLDRGTVWLDTGTFSAMVQAAEYVRVIEERQGLKLGCVEEAAWRAGLIDDDQLMRLAEPLRRSGYGEYLLGLLDWGRGNPQ